ncbi:MAG: hypothetical protein KA788_13275 [Lacunisphaera sp.]|nr:hypothetical protein [Lacunisphaera sp.]
MAAKERNGVRPGSGRQGTERSANAIAGAVSVAIKQGFVVGREVLVGNIPGIVVGYNIAAVGTFLGNSYPLVVRTELGVTKCALKEVSLV